MTHFGTIFGFIDDLTALSEFERSFHEVYPPELESKKEQHGYLEGSFLDLLIYIVWKEEKDSFHFSCAHALLR